MIIWGRRTYGRRAAIFALGLLFAFISDAHPEEDGTDEERSWEGRVTLGNEFYFYAGGFADNHGFLEKYRSYKDYDGTTNGLYFVDMTNLTIQWRDRTMGDVLYLERTSRNPYNQDGQFMAKGSRWDITGAYALFMSQTPVVKPVGLGTIGNNGVSAFSGARQFNDFTFGKDHFPLSRLEYGTSVTIHSDRDPAEQWYLEWQGTYEGYSRDGRRFADFELESATLSGAGNARPAFRWRGIAQEYEEEMNRYGMNMIFSHSDMFLVSYSTQYEKFVDSTGELTLQRLFGTGTGLGDVLAASANESVLFVPDTEKLINRIEVKSTLESPWHFNAGYSNVILDQDSYTVDEKTAGFDDNGIMSHVAYGIASYEANENVTPSAFIRYAGRDNKGPSFFSSITSAGVVPYINRIDRWEYGTDVAVRGDHALYNLGWKGEYVDRELNYSSTVTNKEIPYDYDDSLSNKMYVKTSLRPNRNTRIRISGEYEHAKETTGTIMEAEQSVRGKTSVHVHVPEWKSTFSPFYQARWSVNGDFDHVSGNGTLVGNNLEKILQTAGMTWTFAPTQKDQLLASCVWSQDHIETTFVKTDTRLNNDPVTFRGHANLDYNVDVYTLTTAWIHQLTQKISSNVNYTLVKSDGSITNFSEASTILNTHENIDTLLHTVGLVLDYQVDKDWSLETGYYYTYFDDDAEPSYSGSVHAIALLATKEF